MDEKSPYHLKPEIRLDSKNHGKFFYKHLPHASQFLDQFAHGKITVFHLPTSNNLASRSCWNWWV